MQQVEEHVGKLEAQLAQWGAKLDELLADADLADAEAKIDYRRRVDALKSKYDVAHARLAEFKAAGSDKWETFKTGVEIAWKDLEAAFQELSN